MKYHFNDIEAKWRKYWEENQTFKAENQSDKPKYYVLDMFPYPSGAGLHVGHPLGYIASDIYARYKRHKGFNVLHPMGYDSFGLPAEQYAIQTGQHPAITTETNINRYREQLDRIGFSFDWSREVRTSNPDYYKWTQWIFTELFHSWYNKDSDKAEPIESLITRFTNEGNEGVNAVCDENIVPFTAEMWNAYDEVQQQKKLLQYRLTYLAETEVNWCPALGTVLANDEIVNGVSERGGHPVVRKKMKQWSMRITAYAQRLLDGLNQIDWPQPLKDSQTNWIGRSQGAAVSFKVQSSRFKVDVFTTRPDTIFGASFMTLAPEHELVEKITTPEQKEAVEAYIEQTAKRSERERMADVKTISGVFTGAYAEHPFSKEPIPIWIGDYVLASYGTGAVMAVPCGDERDYAFAKHFNIPIPNIFDQDISENAFTEKEGFTIVNSDFLNGLGYKEAIKKAIEELEKIGQGTGKINYRLRDAVFSRQRYWGEPFPVYYVNGLPKTIDPEHLPVQLPEVEKYLPTEDGQPPLGRADVWAWDAEKCTVVSNELVDNKNIFPLELNTMPGWAGSSWYLFRYMDANNNEEFASPDALDYWQNVDLYIGGSEHATGHLLYSRFWTKFLYDRGFLKVDEPFKKLINQGMILGESAFVYRMDYRLALSWNPDSKENNEKKYKQNTFFISKNLVEDYQKINGEDFFNEYKDSILSPFKDVLIKNDNDVLRISFNLIGYTPIHTDVSLVDISNKLDIEAFRDWREEYKNAIFILDNGEIYDPNSPSLGGGRGEDFTVSREVEKMSKSKYNVVNPDDICDQYGADTLRMYEMFLGPLEQAKPWNMAGITGVHSFLKKFWKLYCDDNGLVVTDTPASKDSLKTLHKTIKKVAEDIENFSFNTSVSTFMIAVNELTAQKCNSREVLEPLLVLISPYAPHIAEELWDKLGQTNSISTAPFPEFDASHLVESSKEYPISFNGKMRFTLELPLDLSKEEIEKEVMAHEKTQHYLEGRAPKKVIIIPGKIVNIVG
ncbi:MAG: leucine--tRNA ligase [Flavobacteriaceae bacterium]|nr:leucine--tRNA ligase [Flavobacteriaceae bacterium]